MADETSIDFKSVNMDSCVTEREKVQLEFNWTIKEFFDLPQKIGEYLESTVFPTAKNQPAYWTLKLYPKGANKENEDSVSLFLRLTSAESSEVSAKYTFVSQDTAGDTIVQVKSSFNTFSKPPSSWGYFNYVTLDKLKESLQKSKTNTLIIHCSITITMDFCNKPGPSSQRSNKIFTDFRLSKDFQSLLLDDCFADFVINIDNRKFKVHKCILRSRSSVFAAMLTSNMEESKSSEVTLEDMDPDVFEKVLQFIYTGSLDTTDSDALYILPVADRYNIVSLKEQCVVLANNICTENAVKTLILADKHSLQELKTAAIKYICENKDVISKSDDWSLIAFSYPRLAAELFLASSPKTSEENAAKDV